MPRVIHEQGEVVYMDLLGSFSNHVSLLEMDPSGATRRPSATQRLPSGYGKENLPFVDPTGRGWPLARCLVVEVQDPEQPLAHPGNIQVICPPGLQASVEKMYHTRGHLGIWKTVDAICRQYAWRSLYSHVVEFITRQCPICVEKS